MTEYEPYGVRHFLRDSDAEGMSELRRHTIPLTDGSLVDKGFAADTDAVDPPRSRSSERWCCGARRLRAARLPPIGSAGAGTTTRSGNAIRRQRRCRRGSVSVTTSTPTAYPGAMPSATSQPGGPRRRRGPEPVIVPLSQTSYPRSWSTPSTRYAPMPSSAGTISAEVRVAHREGDTNSGSAARCGPQVDLSRRRPRDWTRSVSELNDLGGYVSLGSAHLDPGVHRVEVHFNGSDLHPGSGGQATAIGPLVLTTARPRSSSVVSVPAADAETSAASGSTGSRLRREVASGRARGTCGRERRRPGGRLVVVLALPRDLSRARRLGERGDMGAHRVQPGARRRRGAGRAWPATPARRALPRGDERSSATASLVCDFSGAIAPLLAARCVQAVGGAAAVCASLEFLPSVDGRRASSCRRLGAAGALGAALGPGVGGLLTELDLVAVDLPVQVPIAASVGLRSSGAARAEARPIGNRLGATAGGPAASRRQRRARARLGGPRRGAVPRRPAADRRLAPDAGRGRGRGDRDADKRDCSAPTRFDACRRWCRAPPPG